MKSLNRISAIAILPLLVSACDMERVSEGSWDILVETPAGTRSSVWTISDEPALTMSGETPLTAAEVDLQGSRIFWSTEMPDSNNPSGPMLRETFAGTVNGDSLAGTIYTTSGNFSVRGTRR